MSNVLIVDDEPAICWAFREALEEDGHDVSVAASAEDALSLTDAGCRPDVVVLDVRLPGMDGLSAMQHLQKRIGQTPVIVITAFGNLDTAVKAIEQGAFDYLLKPFDLDQATAVLRRALDAGKTRSASRAPDAVEVPENTSAILGACPAMQQVFKQIALVTASDVSVLITGESGTGKELVARAIHRHSSRRDGIFLPVCIAALSPGLVESELFGHVRGSFTNATEDRKGLLELGQGGTVLLDEIADIPPALQVKLLRAIEQREITPVGDTRIRPTNIRVLAATNRPLPEMIAKGEFREDLFFRLGVFQIHLPPLRDRRDDIPLLAEHFLQQCRTGAHAANLYFSESAIGEMQKRTWQGNVRELRNAVEHAAIVARNGEIRSEHLPAPMKLSIQPQSAYGEIQSRLGAWTEEIAEQVAAAEGAPELYEKFLQLVEPPLLQAVLQHCGQNRAAAAQLLGLHRATLRQKLRRYGVN